MKRHFHGSLQPISNTAFTLSMLLLQSPTKEGVQLLKNNKKIFKITYPYSIYLIYVEVRRFPALPEKSN